MTVAGPVTQPDPTTHDIEPFRVEHFDRWYALWIDAVDQRWAGPTADLAKTHAAHIAAVLARTLLDLDWQPPAPPRPAGAPPPPTADRLENEQPDRYSSTID